MINSSKNRRWILRSTGCSLSGLLAFPLALSGSIAVADSLFDPEFSLILDGYYRSGTKALSEKEKGFGLGHTELSIRSPVDGLFYGTLTGVVHQHDHKAEFELEEAFIKTLSLPAGVSVRAGRFLSGVGYLNSQHVHEDAFTDRPVVYRALLGSHYYDDGVGFELVMPVDLRWTVGAEAFSGRKMRAHELAGPESVGVFTGYTKIGGDLGENHRWQVGLSYLRNRNGFSPLPSMHHHDDKHSHDHVHEASSDDHGHCHTARFTGKHLYGVDMFWKWTGEHDKGNSLALFGEYLRADKVSELPLEKNYHDGWYLGSVYQINPQWAGGIRYGEFSGQQALTTVEPHRQQLKETELMVSWNQSHWSVVRLQYTHQQGDGFHQVDDNIVTLQYVMTLGTHDHDTHHH